MVNFIKKIKEAFEKIKRVFESLKKIGPKIKKFFKRFEYAAYGIRDSVVGTAIAVKNIAITSGLAVADFFTYGFESARYGYFWTECAIEKLKSLKWCFVFYLFDMVLYFMFMIILSICFVIDVFFFRKIFGVSLVKLIYKAIKEVMRTDEMIYSYTGFHIARYPDVILDLCYRCKNNPDIERVNQAYDTLEDDLYNRFPRLQNEYINKFIEAGQWFADTVAPL